MRKQSHILHHFHRIGTTSHRLEYRSRVDKHSLETCIGTFVFFRSFHFETYRYPCNVDVSFHASFGRDTVDFLFVVIVFVTSFCDSVTLANGLFLTNFFLCSVTVARCSIGFHSLRQLDCHSFSLSFGLDVWWIVFFHSFSQSVPPFFLLWLLDVGSVFFFGSVSPFIYSFFLRSFRFHRYYLIVILVFDIFENSLSKYRSFSLKLLLSSSPCCLWCSHVYFSLSFIYKNWCE